MKKEKGSVFILGTVKGLVSERDKIQKSFDSFHPDVMAISISKEGLLAMADYLASDEEREIGFDNVEEERYAKELERFGEVSKPPPSFVRSWELSNDTKVPLIAVDLDDEEFTDLYCHHVSGIEWLKQPSKQRGLARKKFSSQTPEDFAIEWDEFINGSKAMKSIEAARVGKISREVNELAKRYHRIMLIVDHERSQEVQRNLMKAGCKIENE